DATRGRRLAAPACARRPGLRSRSGGPVRPPAVRRAQLAAAAAADPERPDPHLLLRRPEGERLGFVQFPDLLAQRLGAGAALQFALAVGTRPARPAAGLALVAVRDVPELVGDVGVFQLLRER